jgi:hypothetical protein
VKRSNEEDGEEAIDSNDEIVEMKSEIRRRGTVWEEEVR